MSDLKKCPCGEIPKLLTVNREHERSKYGYASGSCCGDWEIEFKCRYSTEQAEVYKAAMDAWDRASRGFN